MNVETRHRWNETVTYTVGLVSSSHTRYEYRLQLPKSGPGNVGNI